MPSQSIEDYLECILALVEEKGYARAVDIASALNHQQSSVTRMVQRLDEKGYVVYEKYRGLVLTASGLEVARRIQERHRTLEEFLGILGVDRATILRDVEGIEHHLSPATLTSIGALIRFLERNPECLGEFKRYREGRALVSNGDGQT